MNTNRVIRGQEFATRPRVALQQRLWMLFAALLALASSGCASLFSDMDPPKVNVENVRSLPNHEGGPRFEITLRISNPNAEPLDIVGISYTIDILERELVSGVTSEVPLIEPYSEATVKLEAGVNLFQVIRLVAGLGMEPSDDLQYRFGAKIDFRGLVPTQRVEETGSINLKP